MPEMRAAIAALGLGEVLCLAADPRPVVAALHAAGLPARGATPGASLGTQAPVHAVLLAGPQAALAPLGERLAELAALARDTLVLLVEPPTPAEAPAMRAWWEERAFAAGLRKHPAYYRFLPYETLGQAAARVLVILEPLPAAAAKRHTLASLQEERDLHMDMMRVTGERSDAHVGRYEWACGFLKPGDRVLDAACGLGYGAHLMAQRVERATVLGIDGSASAVAYATDCYGGKRVAFREGLLPQALAGLPAASFDAVVSFETLEHVEDPPALLAAYRRLLVPGGRLVVSVPHDWSDASGRDPNPFHLQVYDWPRLEGEVEGAGFLLEQRSAQTASRAKVAARGKAWEARPRALHAVAPSGPRPDSEWCLLTAMKTPLEEGVPYEERVFANAAGKPPVSMAGYRYPWLAHALIHFTHRLREPQALEALADEVMRRCAPGTLDHDAALCVKAYRVLDRAASDAEGVRQAVAAVDARPRAAGEAGVALRWRISLAFVKARLLQASGDLARAREAFAACGAEDVRGFDIHLATKTTEACFQAGRLSLALGDRERARREWQAGIEQGRILLSVPVEQVLLAPELPNLFNHGDGVREYALAWDSIARCANGLHLLAVGGPVAAPLLDASFQHEYAVVTRDLVEAREHLPALASALEAAHRGHEAATTENAVLRQQLGEVRALLLERDAHLRQALADLAGRDEDLVRTRQDLVDRTRTAERMEAELAALAREVEARDARLQDLLDHPWRNLLRRSRDEPR